MTSTTWRSATVAILALAVVNLGFPGVATAGIVETGVMVRTDREASLAAIQAQLNRADVRAELLKLGVDSASVEQRMATLSDGELAQLSKRMQDQPAGGILAVIGATFVVLLILELVGVIDIFKRVPAR